MTSPILERVLGDIKTAMKAGEKARLLCLRGLHSEIKNAGINQRSDITDEVAIDVAAKALKQRKESLEQFSTGGRKDLVDQCRNEIQWIEQYLPQQLSEEEIADIVDQCLAESGASSSKDMGKVMKLVMPRVKGKSDGKLVSRLVNEKLSNLSNA